MSVQSAIQEVAEILELPDAAAQANIIRIENIAKGVGVSKPELLTKAQQFNAAKRNRTVQVVIPGKVATGSLGFTITSRQEALSAVLDSLPFRQHIILEADTDGNLKMMPYCKPGKKYLLMEVPDGVKVNAQPPAIIAHGAMRCVCSLIADGFKLAEPKAIVEAKLVTEDKETRLTGEPVVDSPTPVVPPSREKRGRRATVK